MFRKLGLTSILLSLFFVSCGSPEDMNTDNACAHELAEKMPNLEGNEKNLNVMLLLDISDGISDKYPGGAMRYHEMDCGYINSIIDAFTMHLLTKTLRKTNDQIKFFVEPIPPEQKIIPLLENLKDFSFTKNNASIDGFCNMRRKFQDNVTAIYDVAIDHGNFPGSDLWGFFDTKVKDYMDTSKRNLLFVLTDGYPYHKSNTREKDKIRNYVLHRTIKQDKLDNNSDWENRMNSEGIKLLPTRETNLDKLEVFVLGLRKMKGAENNPYEIDILKKFWKDWFLAMGLKEENIFVKESRLPRDHEEGIRTFIGLK